MTPARLFYLLALLAPYLAASTPSAVFFLENRAQPGADAGFLVRGADLAADFEPSEIVLHLPGKAVRMCFLGTAGAVLRGHGRPAGRVRFLFGDAAPQWTTEVPAYQELAYGNLYAGIDMVYSTTGRQLKSEFHVSAGADPELIRWRYRGATTVRLDSGALVLSTGTATFREAPPEVYQERGGERVPIPGRFHLSPNGIVSFRLGHYDRSLPLIIDPVLSYSSYLGGSGIDNATAIAADASGSVYIAGWTDSANFPTVNAARPRSGGGVDAFIAKWRPGTGMVYCTYLGGSLEDKAQGIAVDNAGNVYVTGSTLSTNFPVTGAYQSSPGGSRDAFLVKLSPTGSMLFSTYLGGSGNDSGYAVAVDAAGNVYVAGETTSTNFPTRNPYQPANRGGADAFLAKFNNAGTQLFFGTYLGGLGDDRARGVTVDSSGTIFLTGGTSATNFPTMTPAQPSNAGSQDAFVTRFAADGSALLYSTYLGGTGGAAYPEYGTAIAVDGAANAYVTGTASSANFPLTGAAQSRFGGSTDAFVTKLSPAGTIVYSTFLGGSSLDYGQSIAVDATGNAIVAGYTASTDFPVISAVQSAPGGGYDAFVVKVAPDGASFVESTYLGGAAAEAGYAVSAGSAGNVYVAGQTASTNLPLKDAVQPLPGGSLDAFLARFTPPVSYQGYHDSSDCACIAGWAWDRNQPDIPIAVDIYDGSTLIATATADQFRQDLKNAGIGNGYHGFRFPTPVSLREGLSHSIRVKFAQSGTDLGFTPRPVACTGPQGFHDSVGCSSIAGWAWYQNQPDVPVAVDILDGATVVGTVVANVYRQDLKNAGIGNGYHGFNLPTPALLKNGQAHSVRVRFAGTAVDLSATPRQLTCSTLEGYHDSASCSYIAGWAWDRTLPVTPVSVDIYDGANFLARTLAGVFRQDLKNAGYGDGFHGFTYPTPAQLKDGAAHTVRIRFAGSGTDLSMTPRPLTCTGP